ncbi:MAG TPA: DUF4861 family protein [Bryobacteraceae bacterium]|nr:DUF4861 family protein [Bryobacteraceae bacterium]
MTISRITSFFLMGASVLAAATPGTENEWLLPNFASRLTVEVSNSGSASVKGLATVPVAKARDVAPNFPGRIAFAIVVNNAGSAPRATIVPSQADDLDGDGTPDQFEFPVSLGAGEHRRVDIYYSTTLDDSISWPKQVQAKHRYGYNQQTATLESELIGYRTYGGFFLDVQAREAGSRGLYNDLAAYVPPRMNFQKGRDVLHIGDTLGLGGIFLRRGNSIYQPPMNVPDYAHKPSPEMVPHYRVIAQGPLRAIIETTLDRWTVGEDVIDLRAQYSIDADETFVRCRFEAVPIRMQPSHTYEVGIGIRDLPNESLSPAPGRLIVSGQQNQRDGKIGLALYFDDKHFTSIAAIPTSDSRNQAVVGNVRLKPGQAVSGEYTAAAAWSGSGIENPGEALAAVTNTAMQRINVGAFVFAATPHPEKVDAESQ